MTFSSLSQLLRQQAERRPGAPAILAPGRPPLTYARLSAHVDDVGRTLRTLGVGDRDRVAVVLPNGPEMAVAILTVSTRAACAPLNPAYGLDELDRYLSELRPRALMTHAGVDSPARRVATAHGVRVVELSPILDAEAGLFTLSGRPEAGPPSSAATGPEDVALLLLTSGTTSRPKIVPLIHANVCASASYSSIALELTPQDRALNVLPLFHGHGLVATVLASLAAGGSVVCAAGPDVTNFFGWLNECRPTWYSAVPTIHQAILAAAARDGERVPLGPLRLIRSGSAPLPPRVLGELERIFGVPVLEFYGMTEVAAAPIACNPLPPRQRKPGSVGVRVGLDVAIFDEEGHVLPSGSSGEICVRGASVMRGYDHDATVDRSAFAGEWFRTGDLGCFDADGYLFLTGRSKEIINRGGEKIAPQEVDDVLMEHPAVARAVSFAVPHATLGEDIAAAVVLRPHASATSGDLRQFALGRLADFKVPRQVLIVDTLPATPTGKVARIGLWARLGRTPSATPFSVAPRTPLESQLVGLWAQLLNVESVGIHDDFFACGGDSLLATQLLARVYELVPVEMPFSSFFEGPTIAEMAGRLEALTCAGAERRTAAIESAPRERAVPTSVAQQRVCELQEVLPGLPFFNILYAVRVTGRLNVTLLDNSLNEIVQRHAILRTTFAVVEGRVVQVIAPALHVPLVIDDLEDLPAAEAERRGHELLADEALRTFDLKGGPLVRTRLLRWSEAEGMLVIAMHQAIADGWSLGVLTDELAALYEADASGTPSPLPPLAIQFADFAAWQRQWTAQAAMVAQLTYWREQLGDPLPPLDFVAARPRRAGLSLRTARRPVTLPDDLSDAVKRASRREGVTAFMVLVAALVVILRRELGQDDVRVATAVANRNHPGADALIGPLVNTVLLRTRVSSDLTARELLGRIRTMTLEAYANQDLPFEDLVEILARERGISPRSLSPVMIILHNATLRRRARAGRTVEFHETNPNMLVPLVTATTFDVVLMLHEGEHGFAGSCVYNADRFEAQTIARMLGDFEHVLRRILTDPERPVSTLHPFGNGPAQA